MASSSSRWGLVFLFAFYHVLHVTYFCLFVVIVLFTFSRYNNSILIGHVAIGALPISYSQTEILLCSHHSIGSYCFLFLLLTAPLRKTDLIYNSVTAIGIQTSPPCLL